MSQEGNMSNAGGCSFGIVMRADSLMEFFFFMVVVWGRSLVQKISEGDQDGCRDGLEGGFS